jgi:hypothetical protein
MNWQPTPRNTEPSRTSGKVSITRQIDRDVEPARLKFRWQETDGPPWNLREEKVGSALLESVIPTSTTRFVFDAGGLMFELDAPDCQDRVVLILVLHLRGYDEPEILPSSSRQICLTGADVGQVASFIRSWPGNPNRACLSLLRRRSIAHDFVADQRLRSHDRPCRRYSSSHCHQ